MNPDALFTFEVPALLQEGTNQSANQHLTVDIIVTPIPFQHFGLEWTGHEHVTDKLPIKHFL